ncbi:MAG TPA: hypothetical protein VGQ12_07840 [Candidatus Angelobacter sp.]|jgi:hypothetical protein|nr:hypothetical protein [Candidatus Angelobacter sp.]
MKTIIRMISIMVLTMGFCATVSASGDQPIEQAVIAPPALDCCIPPCPPLCPGNPPTALQK